MSSQGSLATAAQEWQMLRFVGANGANIHEYHKKTKKIGKQKTNNNNMNTHSTNNISIIQQDLHGNPEELTNVEEFDSQMTRKPHQTMRIMLHNIDRLPIDSRLTKSKQIVTYVANKQIDAALLTQIGLNWKKIHNNDRWFERVQEAFRYSHSCLAHNTTEAQITDTVQFGGVCTMAVDDIAHCTQSHRTAQGKDQSKLGRWSRLQLEGKQGHHLRLVSATAFKIYSAKILKFNFENKTA
jgi:hypothetical protein